MTTEKAFVWGIDNVAIAQRTKRGLEDNVGYLSALTFYQDNDNGNAVRFFMHGAGTLQKFSAFLVSHVGLPEVDWKCVENGRAARMDFENLEPMGDDHPFVQGYRAAIQAVQHLYEQNRLPSKLEATSQ